MLHVPERGALFPENYQPLVYRPSLGCPVRGCSAFFIFPWQLGGHFSVPTFALDRDGRGRKVTW
jgi:hypothetical protein